MRKNNMKKTLKMNQRKKQLNRQHHKIASRRLSHFQQAVNQSIESQADTLVSQ